MRYEDAIVFRQELRMFIAYIALGLLSGIAAAVATLVLGNGLLLAFAAYVLGGMAGIAACVLWLLLPRRGGPDSPATLPIPPRHKARTAPA